jgi:adenylosuccinate lyase
MIPRYSRQEMASIWSDESRLQLWLEIELLAAEAMAEEGMVPKESVERLRAGSWKMTSEDVGSVLQLEEQTKHDVIAFLTHLERKMGTDAKYLHFGMTSSDVLDTSFAVQLQRASDLLQKGVVRLRETLKRKAQEHRHTLMIGRTHGMHAEPITFGMVLALWYEELGRQLIRLEGARERISVGKISGAVGTYAHLPMTIEERVCKSLGIGVEPISNQIVQRDRHAEYFCVLANLGATLEKMAVNIRHMQRTEVAEASEPFSANQQGSSAMPHKRNPIGCENLTGIARLLRGYAVASLENVALWHERDISHSSVERVIAPDATIIMDYALHRMDRIMQDLRINTEQMKKNLELSGGSFFSQSVLLALVRSGMERQSAYKMVQRNAILAEEKGWTFAQTVANDAEIFLKLGKENIDACFNLERILVKVDSIFQRVFGKE